MNKSILKHIYPALLWAFIFVMAPSAIHAQQDEVIVVDDATDTIYDSILTEVNPDSPVIEYTHVSLLGYPSDSIDTRELEPGIIDSIKKEEAFWYADYDNQSTSKKQPEQKKERKSFLQTETFKTLVWALMIFGFVMLLVWYLADSNINIFKRSEKVFSDPDAWDDPIHSDDLQAQIQQAVTQQDYRLATRLMFLQLLKRMNDLNIIEYHNDFTNNDYRRHLQGTRYATSFDAVARQYEFVWYGKWQPGAGHFEVIKNHFTKIDNQLATA